MNENVNVSGSPEAPAAATPAVSAPQSATPAAPAQAPATGATATGPNTSEQGREGWVPSYRVRETREAAIREANQTFAAREQQYQDQLRQVQSQLHALVGVRPPQNPEQDAIRQQFASLFPKLAALEERGQDVMGLLERAGDLEAQTSHYWQQYGQTSMDRLFSTAAKDLGSPLSDEGKRALHSSFVGFVQSSPEMTARYAQDPTIVDEFWRAFSSSLIDPVRRSATATVAGRAAASATLPQDTTGGVPRATPVPQPANIDERVSAAWQSYKAKTNQG